MPEKQEETLLYIPEYVDHQLEEIIQTKATGLNTGVTMCFCEVFACLVSWSNDGEVGSSA